MVTVVNFVMYTLLKLKKKSNSQERAEQEKIAAREFWKLEILLVVGRSEKAQLQTSSGERRASAYFHHRILQRRRKCCFWMEEWDSLQGTGWSCLRSSGSPHRPLPCCWVCWVTATPHHRTVENHFLENINQETECFLCDLIRQEERPEDTITRACNQ